MRLTITFNTGYNLIVSLRDSDFVRRWVDLLEQELKRTEILQEDSYSFLYTEQLVKDKLIDAIKIVNEFTKREFISLPNEDDFESTDFYNHLHEKFEKLAGPDYDQPTRIMITGPEKIKTAIRHINRFCHRLENRPYKKERNMRIEFLRPLRKKLLEEDYKLFEDKKPGVIYLDYSTLGKSLLECYNDNLDPNYEGMKIQHHYGPNFVICFESDFHLIKDEFIDWLKKHGYENIPNQELGAIILGEFDDVSSVEQQIRKTSSITNLRIERNNNG
jgi:hypothetical protein